MAFNAGSVSASLTLKTRSFVASLRQASRGIRSFSQSSRRGSNAVNNFGASLRRAATRAAVAVTAFLGLRAAFRGLRSAIAVSAEFEQLEVRLRAFLGSQREATKALENFTKLSSRTPFAVKQIVEGAATLSSAALGNRESLEELTITASNLAAVTGLSFQEAASNLQRALAGGIGAADLFRERGVRALIESVQGIPDLTKVPLAEMEQAFKDTFGEGGVFGTAAEDLSRTLGGALSNIGDATTNLQDAIGDAFAPAIIAGAREFLIPALERLRDLVRENNGGLRELAAQGLQLVGRGIIAVARTSIALITGFADARTGVIALQTALLQLAKTALQLAKITPVGFLADLAGAVDLDEGLRKVNIALAGLEEDGVAAASAAEDLRSSLSELDAGLKRVGASLDAADFSGAAREEQKLADAADDTANSLGKGNAALSERLKHLREITGISPDLEESAESVAKSVREAAEETKGLANSAREADAAFQGTASSARSASAAVSAGDSRRSGGSLGLVGSSAAETAARLRAFEQNINRSGGIFGRAQRQSGRAVANQLAGALRGQIEEETRQFTSQIISELNRQGVTDPAQRQQFVQQRLDEARRLGLVTTPGSARLGGRRGGSE